MEQREYQIYVSASKEINKINIPTDEGGILLNLYSLKYLDYNMENKKRKLNQSVHAHKYFELLLMAAGENTYHIEGVDATIGKGEFLLIMPGVHHNYVAGTRECYKIAMCFDWDVEESSPLYQRFFGLREKRYVTGMENGVIDTLMTYLFGEMDAHSEISGMLMRQAILLILMQIIERHSEPAAVSAEPAKRFVRDSEKEFYNRVVAYLQGHLSEPSLVSRMADALYISERQLRRRLQSYCGKSVGALLDEIKYARARELILAQVDTAEICEILGFSDYRSYARFCKRLRGLTPKELELLVWKENVIE